MIAEPTPSTTVAVKAMSAAVAGSDRTKQWPDFILGLLNREIILLIHVHKRQLCSGHDIGQIL